MTLPASDWLALALLLCLYAWLPRRLVAFTLPLAVVLAALAVYIPTGTPRFTAPPAGRYTVLGADIQVDVAIFALLKPENGPAMFFRLPYSTKAANDLQGAKDEAGEGGGVSATIGEDGGVKYDGPPPVQGDPPKQPEAPAVTLP